MTYQQTVQWMFAQLPMYQQQGASAYRKDLTNALLLSDYLNKPEKHLKLVHIAGTNGKGSTSHMLASILQEAGYKTGLFTSPHLKDFRERIKIDGAEISEQFVIDFIAKHRSFFEGNNLSFFEMSTGLAFEYFRSENVDIAVIETGLGGRLDSTNIITPILSVITNIGLDHTQFLGDTLQAIAGEKAGIIKPNVPIVVGEHTPETKSVFVDKAKQCGAPIYFAQELISDVPDSDLTGIYQEANKKTVVQATIVLNGLGFRIPEPALKRGLLSVVANTGLMGRWQKISDAPLMICDTAHNRHGLEIVMQQVVSVPCSALRMVIGFTNDKNLDDILPLFPKDAQYYFCKPNLPRGLDAGMLQNTADTFGLLGKAFESVTAAYKSALTDAKASDFIYVGGSTFVVAEIL